MSHHGSPFKQTRQDEHPFDMSQESMTTSDSAFSRQSFGSIYDNYEASEAAQKSRMAAQNSALYHSASLPCPLRSFVSFGRTSNVTQPLAPAALTAPPAPPPRPSTDSGSVSGMLPTFSPVFSSFGRHTSLDSVRSQPISIPANDGSRRMPAASGVAFTAPLLGPADADEAPAAKFAGVKRGPETLRSSFADDDIEVSYRDWHNGVFSPSW